MASVKPKRRKIPYIGKPLTASEIKAEYPLTPEEQAAVARAVAAAFAPRPRRRKTKERSSAKTVRAK
jgi:hypothetical protein